MSEDLSTPTTPDGRAGSRVAFGTAARAVGEMVAKAASVVFYLVLVRELGPDKFGDFVFGLSLSQVVLTFAAIGTEELLARNIARDPNEVHRLFSTVSALKLVMVGLFALVILFIVVIAGYRGESLIAIMLVTGGTALERQARNFHAVFQGFERQDLLGLSLIAARFFTAAVGVFALLRGADLVLASLIFMCGSGLGNLAGWALMRRYVVKPARLIDLSAAWPILKAGLPLGLVTVLYLLLLRLDSTMLGFLAGGAGDNSELGQYGAAQRLIESTMFISWAVGGAMLPWLSRHSDETEVTLARGYEVSLKALTAVLLPIAVGYGVLADPLIDLLYGPELDGAVMPLRLLGVMTVLFGVNTMVGVLMISRDTPADFVRPAVAVIAQNVAFNFVLIPAYGASGAAANAIISGVLLALWTQRNARRQIGPVSPIRVLATPVMASAALAGVVIVLGGLNLIALAAGASTYAIVYLGLERLLYPGDFKFYLAAVGRAGGRAAVDSVEAHESADLTSV